MKSVLYWVICLSIIFALDAYEIVSVANLFFVGITAAAIHMIFLIDINE